MCAFCNCGERSLLGQGDLTKYDPTPGLNVLKKSLRKERKSGDSLDDREDKEPKHSTWRRQRGPVKLGRSVDLFIFHC